MGFRDIAMFNDSLLAKPLHNSDSLFYKFFKSCFFPTCFIMEAKKSQAGSHAWTNILHGRDVTFRGCQWRIGNGKLVSIWQNFWLPRKKSPQVLSPIIDSMAVAKVNILIDEMTRQWNHGLIEGIFIPKEVDLVKEIPLSQQYAEDSLFWPFTHNGSYTSKFGYRFLKAGEEAEVYEE